MNRQKEEILVEMDKRLDRKLKDTEDGIIKSVAEVIGNGIQPTLEDHEERIKKLEKHAVTAP